MDPLHSAQSRPMSPEESAFVRSVEASFLTLAGRGLMLSPLDELKILEWARAKIPLDLIQRAMERAFEQLREQRGPVQQRPPRLSFCSRFIWEELRKHKQQKAGKAPPLPKIETDPAIAERLRRLCAQLAEEGKAERDPTIRAAYRRAYQRLKLLAATRSAREEVERIDDLLCDELYQSQPPHLREDLEQAVRQALLHASTIADESAKAERLAYTRRSELRAKLQIVRLEL